MWFPEPKMFKDVEYDHIGRRTHVPDLTGTRDAVDGLSHRSSSFEERSSSDNGVYISTPTDVYPNRSLAEAEMSKRIGQYEISYYDRGDIITLAVIPPTDFHNGFVLETGESRERRRSAISEARTRALERALWASKILANRPRGSPNLTGKKK
jgi:hypothetical protein